VRQLAAAGFGDVWSLDGGVAARQAAGLPLTK
jgi:rhodanese-related sulfurtransferase